MLQTDSREVLQRLTLACEAETGTLAAGLAAIARAGDVFALWGDLGTGKSVFARAFIRAATGRPDEEVPSPTFTLLQTYDAGETVIHHFDLYRLEESEEAYALGIEDAFADGVSLIEWPDRLAGLLPPDRLDIHLAHGAEPTAREVTISGPADWAARIGELDLG